MSLTREKYPSKPTRGEAYELLTRDNKVALAINSFFDFFLLSGTIVSHSSKPTRGEAHELLLLDAENTITPLFFCSDQPSPIA